ncbi:hypothetical protein NUW54_g13679 [Trametes sanguinea]|uniref:Uncharacterized protein n=1 Tax=Trametes sanguinea TaxID=158606 RepID=A0ACC1MK09_9APHY|nr:hypothetical protein NUW54_g13679 [Trametes sanguinea]
MPRPPSHALKKCLRLPKREPTLRDVRIPTLSIREGSPRSKRTTHDQGVPEPGSVSRLRLPVVVRDDLIAFLVPVWIALTHSRSTASPR